MPTDSSHVHDWDWHTDFSRPPMNIGEVYAECIREANKMRHDAYERLLWFQSEAMWEALAECAQ